MLIAQESKVNQVNRSRTKVKLIAQEPEGLIFLLLARTKTLHIVIHKLSTI